nr:uncharacterized protein LOC123480177 isoform X2 [Desmodus rotundus]
MGPDGEKQVWQHTGNGRGCLWVPEEQRRGRGPGWRGSARGALDRSSKDQGPCREHRRNQDTTSPTGPRTEGWSRPVREQSQHRTEAAFHTRQVGGHDQKSHRRCLPTDAHSSRSFPASPGRGPCVLLCIGCWCGPGPVRCCAGGRGGGPLEALVSAGALVTGPSGPPAPHSSLATCPCVFRGGREGAPAQPTVPGVPTPAPSSEWRHSHLTLDVSHLLAPSPQTGVRAPADPASRSRGAPGWKTARWSREEMLARGPFQRNLTPACVLLCVFKKLDGSLARQLSGSEPRPQTPSLRLDPQSARTGINQWCG